MTKLYFYFPYMDESGVPMLFLRMSRWVAENYGNEYDCYVIDYLDGAMARNLTHEDKVKVHPYSDDKECLIEDNAIVVFQSNNISFIFQNLKLSPKTKLFWWTLHERCLAPVLIPMPLGEQTFKYHWLYKIASLFYYRFMHGFAKMADDMIAHSALYFMDITTFNMSIRHLPMKTKTINDFLQVPAQDYNGVQKTIRTEEELVKGVNVCWLGRLCNEKTPVLKLTIRKLSHYALQNNIKIKMIVFGFGDHQEEVDNLGREQENKYYNQLPSEPIQSKDIDNFLLNNVDMMVATGTSALEAAKLGVPTIDVDDSFTSSEIKGDYVFKMLSERRNYDLGHDITDADCEEGNASMEHIMDYLIHHFGAFSKESREHFVNYHSMTSAGNKFVGLLNKTSFTFDMIDPKLMQPLWTWKIWVRIRKSLGGWK